jgi:heme oxygenase
MRSSKPLQKNRVELRTANWFGRVLGFGVVETPSASISARCGARASSSAEAPEKPKQQRYPGENKGFVEEMRFVAMRLHTKDQAKEGEKEKPADVQPVGKWEPTVEGYLKFLVDSKKVYDTMETIVAKASHPSCKFHLSPPCCIAILQF